MPAPKVLSWREMIIPCLHQISISCSDSTVHALFSSSTMNSYIRFKPYQYTALAEGDIRLVSLQPDEFYKPIRISISHWPLQPVRPPLAVEEETDKLLALLAPNERLFENDEGGYLVTNPADPQSARLTTLPLEQIVPGHWPRYEALSHAHGETYETEVIFIGPVHGPETMDVCGTLAKALRRLRYTNESRNLWIDSICIDLAETGERIKHTQLTSEIYQQAYRIIAWLGEPATSQANADLAWLFSEMQDIGEKLMMTKDGKLYVKNGCDAKPSLGRAFHHSESAKSAGVLLPSCLVLDGLAGFGAG